MRGAYGLRAKFKSTHAGAATCQILAEDFRLKHMSLDIDLRLGWSNGDGAQHQYKPPIPEQLLAQLTRELLPEMIRR